MIYETNEKSFIVNTDISIVIVSLILFLPSRTPRIKGNKSIASIDKIILGGIDQFIMTRGEDTDNPILLFLHGGPGYSQISFARKYQEELEENFLVVNWDHNRKVLRTVRSSRKRIDLV
ncbi:hypothetical protein I5677_08330 [Mobilitalea sibirica]|uniref:Prolyl aminopeptidase n=1 Tax=Mobilitalea sibirica TaxID=1462919 RepID=A0A8J7HDL1_9FIRM|nr:hypothetical protein [Mobilitalea sibirica]MBH1940894.1 hypothetical protein [Mobilitalea sibirica]